MTRRQRSPDRPAGRSAGAGHERPKAPPAKAIASGAAPKSHPPEPRLIVGVGASAGGLEALTQLLRALPTDTGMAFVLVQHLDPDHESALTQLLSKATLLPVVEVTDGVTVEPDHIYVIPPNANLSIAQRVLTLEPRAAVRGGTRSIDFFFESLAQDQHERAVGVILSGTASDGTQGLEAIKGEGGITFAQDETAKYDSMPRSAVAAGCVDFILSPENIAMELARIAEHPYVAGRAPGPLGRSPVEARSRAQRGGRPPAGAGPQDGVPARRDEGRLRDILLLLRNHSGVDFSLYKSTTIRRRIARRLLLGKHAGLESYTRFLRGNTAELQALYSDVLIGVTSFFRNPEAFEILKNDVFPALISPRRDEVLRVWVVGCSTGQEAYSLAMAYAEFSERIPRAPRIQIFATDLSEAVLEKARTGLYVKSLVAELSPERLRRFFTEEHGGYRVNKPLRETVVFARQNVLSDPPFSRMDLISCRNLLIYIDPALQETILPMFHYALKPKGCLFLGASESIGTFAELFESVDKKHRIYFKKPGRSPAQAMRLGPRHPAEAKGVAGKPAVVTEGYLAEIGAQREADRLTLKRFAPAGVLVNATFQVLQFRGDMSPYLKLPTGPAGFGVLNMAREGLMLPLQAALSEAKKKNKTIRRERLTIRQGGKTRTASLEVVPLTNLKERCYLIFFLDAAGHAAEVRSLRAGEAPRAPQGPTTRKDIRHAAGLERELAEMHDYVHSLQEQHEAANEELQSSNEEITSANEELQSLNEELETSKEELESANEELTTVNDEMVIRNAELGLLNSDLTNLQASTRLAVVLLDRNLTIRRFSPRAEKKLNLLATDLGRPFSGIRHDLDMPDLERLLTEVIDTVQERDLQVQDREGRWHLVRLRPYLTVDNKVDGAVLVVIDIDELKRAELAAAEAREKADTIVRTVPDPLMVLDAGMRVRSANEAFYRTFRMSPADVEGRGFFEFDGGAWNIPRLRQLVEEIVPRNSLFDDFEVMHKFERLGRRTLLVHGRALKDESGKAAQVLLVIRDVTQVLAFQAEMRRSELRYRRLFEASGDGVLLIDPETHKIVDANPFSTELLGHSRDELLGKALFEIGLLKDRAAEEVTFQKVMEGGHVHGGDVTLQTGQGTDREVEFVSSLYTEDGERVIQCNIHDITERKQAERLRGLLTAELDHRVRNTLATVQSIAYQTGRHSASIEEFQKSFEARLTALSKTHNLLTAAHWTSVSLRDLVMAELTPYGRDGRSRFTVSGQEIRLDPRQTLALGLGLHELATNAAKYGALSLPTGTVDISWSISPSVKGPRMTLQWTEDGGPAVKQPERSGFGSQLMQRVVMAELEADMKLDFLPQGVRCVLQFPLSPQGTTPAA